MRFQVQALRRAGAVVAAGLAVAVSGLAPAWAQDKPLTVKVFTAGEVGLHANAAIVMGEKEAVIVDAPFTRADAYRLAAEVLDTGRKVKAILVTHSHPDHYFGVAVLHEAFPDAQILAQTPVAHAVLDAFPKRLAFWGPQIGQNAPRYQLTPTPYDGKTIKLEGQEIQLIGPIRGDAPLSTLVWVPSAKTAITGDILFDQGHIYLAGTDKASRADWVKSLDMILALKPETIVPGHMPPGSPMNQRAVDFTRGYIATYEQTLPKASTPAEFKALMRKAYPKLPADEFVENATAESAMKEKGASN